MKKQVMCKDCKKVGKCGKPYVEISTYAERCPLFDAKKPTNYERIKGMSLEEMAQFITDEKPFCTLNECDCIYGWHGSDCEKHAKEWLESEVQEDE